MKNYFLKKNKKNENNILIHKNKILIFAPKNDNLIFISMPKSKKELIRLRDFPINQENPFMKNSVQEIEKHFVKKWVASSRTDKKAVLTAIDPETGETLGHTTFMKSVVVDDEKFSKLFLTQFEVFFDLSNAGVRVFGYVMKCLKPKEDIILFDRDACIEYTGCSQATVYRGLTELANAGIIARTKSDNLYYINPTIVWNGDRVTFVTDYRRERKKNKIEDKNQLQLDFVKENENDERRTD